MNGPTKNLLAAVFDFTPRPAEAVDLGFVYSTLEAQLRPEYRDVSSADLKSAISKLLNDELAAGATLLVAGASMALWGWVLVAADGVVVFAYVRAHYRRARIATRLLEAAGVNVRGVVKARLLTKMSRALAASGEIQIRRMPVL